MKSYAYFHGNKKKYSFHLEQIYSILKKNMNSILIEIICKKMIYYDDYMMLNISIYEISKVIVLLPLNL